MTAGKFIRSVTFIAATLLIDSFNWVIVLHSDFSENITLRVSSSNKDEGGRIIKKIQAHLLSKVRPSQIVLRCRSDCFNKSIGFDEFVQPSYLVEETENTPGPDIEKCVASVWGLMENNARPTFLNSVNVSIVDSERCQCDYNQV